MIALLLELGADPLAVDGSGQPVAVYASAPETDRRVMEKIGAMVSAELVSAVRGHRPPRGAPMDLIALLALSDWDTATHLLHENPALIDPRAGRSPHGERNDLAAVKWLLAHGAQINGRWASGGAEVTPLHLAARADTRRWFACFSAPGGPHIRDSMHDGDASGWAEYFHSRRSWRFSRITRRTRRDGARARLMTVRSGGAPVEVRLVSGGSPFVDVITTSRGWQPELAPATSASAKATADNLRLACQP